MRSLARNHQCCFRSGLSSHVSSSTRPPTELGRSTERQTQMRCIEECAYLLLPPNIENGGLGAVLLRTISPIPHQVTTWQTSRGWLRTVAPGVGKSQTASHVTSCVFSESRMREICLSGSMSGNRKQSYAKPD